MGKGQSKCDICHKKMFFFEGFPFSYLKKEHTIEIKAKNKKTARRRKAEARQRAKDTRNDDESTMLQELALSENVNSKKSDETSRKCEDMREDTSKMDLQSKKKTFKILFRP